MTGQLAPGARTARGRLAYLGDQVFRACNSEITERKAATEDEPNHLMVAGYFSTGDSDIDDFVIHPAGWTQGLDVFLNRNPRFLWMHDPFTPIGNVVAAKVDQRGLFGRVRFDELDELAVKLHSKVERGFLDTFSVGFRALEPPEFDEGAGQLHFRRMQLMENSLVTIPANINAGVTERAAELDEEALCQRMMAVAGDRWSRAAEQAMGSVVAKLSGDLERFADETKGKFLERIRPDLELALAEALEARVGSFAELFRASIKRGEEHKVADALRNFRLGGEA